MSNIGRQITKLVDAILAHPPTDNAELLGAATQIERDAASLSETCLTQARRLRDYAAVRQAQMDGAPPENTIAPDAR
ncbi:hypothetical protein HLH26_15800 [Gluconacetobacter sp. 1b LMG 1731]|uniref:Uncharacterized protein n=1 Tax=Gluconacetobacter dulcium TaxID=2729096 RepID=A0A7W4INA2_9PROT|nr:hypothetical protein [Gluconacetobacter dulcium]MBB2165967.1 hypothetical protein [Gluconacetobacter dulcium]MBB2195104.1 hypothetical protein [Gluconacetobacter dulcium]